MVTAMTNKPKFKITKRELLDFNTACAEAMLECPQVRLGEAYNIEDRDILLGEINKKQIFKRWINERVLWELGYDEYLEEDVLELIEMYKDYLAQRRLWKRAEKTKQIAIEDDLVWQGY